MNLTKKIHKNVYETQQNIQKNYTHKNDPQKCFMRLTKKPTKNYINKNGPQNVTLFCVIFCGTFLLNI